MSPADATNWAAEIIKLGVTGAVLVWLMMQVTPRLKAVEQAIDRMARAILLWLVTAGKPPTPAVSEQAKEILNEIDQAEARRKPPS